MKTTFTLLLFALFTTLGYSQNERIQKQNNSDKDVLKKTYSKAPFVLEGAIIKTEGYYNATHTAIYTKNTLQVTKIIKGKITENIVEIITDGGQVENDGVITDDMTTFAVGDSGLFMCFPTNREIANSYDKSKTYFSLYKSVYIRYTPKMSDLPIAKHNSLSFYTKKELYEALGFFQLSLQNQIDEEAKSISNEELQKIIDAKKAQLLNNVSTRSLQSTTGITFTFENAIVTGTTQKYFEFDIFGTPTDGSSYLDGAQVDIQFNTAAFGSNIVAGNTVTVTRSTYLTTTNYPYLNKADNATNILRVYFNSDFTTPNRLLLPLTPTALFHVKIAGTCSQNAGLSFPSAGATGGYYAIDATTTDFLFYTPVVTTDVENLVLCNLNISNFTAKVNAGTNDMLTITGSNFGATRGSGYVELKSAEDGGASSIVLDADDYASWSDNQIKIRVPAYSRTTSSACVGTGVIKVSNGTNTFTTTNSVVVYYGVKNYLEQSAPIPTGFTTRKQKFYLTGAKPTQKYPDKFPIKIDYTGAAQFNTASGARGCIEKAIREWTCETHIPFVVIGDTILPNTTPLTLANVTPDGISTIRFTDYTLDNSISSNTIARTLNRPQRCDSATNGRTIGLIPEFDLDIDLNQQWWCDTIYTNSKPASKYDFFEVILHELGHANLLKHNNEFTSIMYYGSEFTNSTPSASRRIYVNIEDYEGGTQIVLDSKNTKYKGNCSWTAVSPDNKCGTIGFAEYKLNNASIQVQPNPFDNQLSVTINLVEASELKISLIDVLGKEIETVNETDKKVGVYNLEFDGSELNNGIYFIQFNVNGQILTKKVIKQ